MSEILKKGGHIMTKEELLRSMPAEKRDRIHFAPLINGHMVVPVAQPAHLKDDDVIAAVDGKSNIVGWSYVKNVKQPAFLR